MRNTEALVSVVVPTYKRPPELIKRSIDSILNQTHQKIELIVVDDSPKEYEKRKQVKEYLENIQDNRVNYIQHELNKGANKARNTGIKASNGNFCAFLDDDDEWHPKKIELQLNKFNSPEIGLVYCRAIIINETTKTNRPIINEVRRGHHYNDLLEKNFIGSNSFVLIRKTALEKVGLYDENLESNQDYDLFLKISKFYQIDCVDEVLVNYYEHGGERITTNVNKQLQGRLGVYENHKVDINKSKKLRLTWEIKEIPLYYKIGERKTAIKQAMKLFTSSPIFFVRYGMGTLDYMRRKITSKKRMTKGR